MGRIDHSMFNKFKYFHRLKSKELLVFASFKIIVVRYDRKVSFIKKYWSI